MVYAAVSFTLTATSNVTVNAPKVSAVFVSGEVGSEVMPGTSYVPPNAFTGESCSVGSSGTTLSCNAISIQAGDYVVLTAVISNTGTIVITPNAAATPTNPSVLSITAWPSNAQYIAPNNEASYAFTITALQPGTSGFTVTVSG